LAPPPKKSPLLPLLAAAAVLAVVVALAVVFARGFCAVMVEAGPDVASAFVEAGVVDEVWWFSAPVVIGGDGRDVFGALGVDDVNAAIGFDVVARTAVGADLLTVLRRRA
jgi:riboflavin biosynthesis pyrimidine reductase